jgi:erythromycin esterase-like protein
MVLEYLDRVDPATAQIARQRYGSLTPWEGDPATYGRAAVTGRYRVCEREVVDMLRDLLAKELEYTERDGTSFLDAVRNAAVVANAERYYRVMYYGGVESWNLRDRHMFDTLEALLRFHGAGSKAIVWEHNSHLGDGAATEMGIRGEINVGHLCRQAFGDTELQSHYFHATLPHQFDEYVWFDESRAVRPVSEADARGLPSMHPFALSGPS